METEEKATDETTTDTETESKEGEEVQADTETAMVGEAESSVKEQILKYHVKINKVKLRGDIYDEFNSFNEMNQFNLSETDQFVDGLAFFGVQVIIDQSYWDNVRAKLKELEDKLQIAPK